MCSSRRISLSGLPPDEHEKICLLAEILGWQVHVERAVEGRAVEGRAVQERAGQERALALQTAEGRTAERWTAERWTAAKQADAAGQTGRGGLIDPHMTEDVANAALWGAGWAGVAFADAVPAEQWSVDGVLPGADQLHVHDDGVTGRTARLHLYRLGNVIRVKTDVAEIGLNLARHGLDRLVLPVPLMALEQLLTFAG